MFKIDFRKRLARFYF